MATVHIDGNIIKPFLVIPLLYKSLSDQESKILQMQSNLLNQDFLQFFAKNSLEDS